MSNSWWEQISSSSLSQGDLLPDCCLPVFLDPTPLETQEAREVEVVSQRLIIVTQSCDLENRKVEFVALCPIHTLDEFTTSNPKYENKKNWDQVRKGREPALHMLASIDSPEDNMSSFIVDFAQIVSLPLEYLEKHAVSLGDRARLRSPFLEHFSQAFARFFMRVGLPSGIPAFK